MPADRLLNTVLQLYQNVHDDRKTDQIVGSTVNLLTTLSNPLNLGVLTSQLLLAPAIWHRRDGLRTSLRIISVYNSAAIRVRQNELDNAKITIPHAPRKGGGIGCDAWVRAVVKGADDRSNRWQHLLVLTGILMGMEGNDRQSLSRSLRNTLEEAVVTAANLALERLDGSFASASVVLALNYVFPFLSDFRQMALDCNALLPIAVLAITGEDGFEDCRFLEDVRKDIRQHGQVVEWPPNAPSFQLLQSIESKPLMGGMGPLSRLAAFAVTNATDSAVVLDAQDSLLEFSQKLFQQWQRNPLSTVDAADETAQLEPNTREATWPILWGTLKKTMYATVAVLQAVVGRSLLDPRMRNDAMAPQVATKSLHTLRFLFFVSSRHGASAFQAYTFTYLTSLDVLARFGDACVSFLTETKPPHAGAVPPSPLDRTLDLFYMNVSEHLPLNMTAEACDGLIVQPAAAYLTHTGELTATMVELFEAAHSAVLSVLSCPHNSPLTVGLVPFYIDALFASFPSQISTRQFRVAFKTIMQIVSPPFPISLTEPQLSETLLEMVRFKTMGAGTDPLPLTQDAIAQSEKGLTPQQEPLSEQSSLVLTLIDSLPFLPLPLVEDWMTLTAQAMNEIANPAMRQPVKDRFWEVLVSGEMDVERATIGVAWWTTKGGRELVVGRDAQQVPMMSGAILDESKSSRL
ncbi:peroxin 8 [Colletotrichum higginsianum IMI 349063]|uniref:Peroxin 8 n=4 Tax=Colletotrichum higginsianum TaxID=80884 RepID=A0A1B7YPS4_COLHI|nr:peroxin 8 [Colletotrichum higginsianum IMI 349063]OBR14031.1 peroxin 8 [Colletotrichum higginsianum IMI 349063]TID01770.1 Peroxisomal membrane protein PEX17 [Colletotrichum higginsianum]GJC95307.1 peroxin 8 [Colletotrichum higginsianum]